MSRIPYPVIEDLPDGVRKTVESYVGYARDPVSRKMLKADMNRPIEKVGSALRARMPWLNDKRA